MVGQGLPFSYLFVLPIKKNKKCPSSYSFNEITEETPTDEEMVAYAQSRSKVHTGNETTWEQYILGQSLGTV